MRRFENSDEFTCLFKISVSRKWYVVCNEKWKQFKLNTWKTAFLICSRHDKHKARPKHWVMQLFIATCSAQWAVSRFTTVNHPCGPLRKQTFTSAGFKGHVCGLWLVDFVSFCLFLFFTFRWLVSKLWLTAAKYSIVTSNQVLNFRVLGSLKRLNRIQNEANWSVKP